MRKSHPAANLEEITEHWRPRLKYRLPSEAARFSRLKAVLVRLGVYCV